MKDIVERTYKRTFQLQYRNESNDSKNQVICKLQEAFREKWSMKPIKVAIAKTYNNKRIIKKVIFLNMFMYNMYV